VVIPHPLPEVNFLMVEIPTPKPYIFMIRVNRQIKCPKSWDLGSSPSPTRIFFENYTHLWNHFANFNQTLPKCSWVILFQSYSLVSYLFIKQYQMILTCNSAVASLMLFRFWYFLFNVLIIRGGLNICSTSLVTILIFLTFYSLFFFFYVCSFISCIPVFIDLIYLSTHFFPFWCVPSYPLYLLTSTTLSNIQQR
jgi:hypothetical protein